MIDHGLASAVSRNSESAARTTTLRHRKAAAMKPVSAAAVRIVAVVMV